MTAAQAEYNVALLLNETARRNPDGIAVVEQGVRRGPAHTYRQVSFRELDEDSDCIAAQLRARGVGPGSRLVLMVPPSIDFVSLVFAIFKTGAVMVLIDPGIGRRHLIRCLSQVNPDGFVAVPRAQAARLVFRRHFPRAKMNITVGPKWFGGTTLKELRDGPKPHVAARATPADPAAIIFTSGSTGPPKGVLYRHGNFHRQVLEIRDFYGIQPGDVDVACFPLFALFNAAMGVTTIFPRMDFTRPAAANPRHIVAAISDWSATQAFGSPALWNTVAGYCDKSGQRFPTLRRILSAGAPVPPHVLRRMSGSLGDQGEIHTPYGATEALPVASISASEVLSETAKRSDQGAGTCVGTHFPAIRWKVVPITEGPLSKLADAPELPCGEIGELVVSGPVVTTEYVTGVEANRTSKIPDGEHFWHRMGDVGYLDDRNRFWYCGRKSQRVVLGDKTMYTVPCEAIINCDPRVYRSALVNAGAAEQPRPAIVVELWPHERPPRERENQQIAAQLLERAQAHPFTQEVSDILIHPSLPVDIRHNSKIFREQVATWAARQLSKSPRR